MGARSLDYGIAAFNNLYKNYNDTARKRENDFELTKEEFRDLTSRNCFYCDKTPSQKIHSSNSKRVSKGKSAYTDTGYYQYNGVDRLDNSKGYVLSNCVPCCKECNSMKNSISIDMIIKIYKECQERGLIDTVV